tara:strand:- start:233 stop:466 length:234 start_codon:yes stop_codon:yes gene_type:complete
MNPEPQALTHEPQALTPEPQALTPEPQALTPAPQALIPGLPARPSHWGCQQGLPRPAKSCRIIVCFMHFPQSPPRKE